MRVEKKQLGDGTICTTTILDGWDDILAYRMKELKVLEIRLLASNDINKRVRIHKSIERKKQEIAEARKAIAADREYKRASVSRGAPR